RALREMEVWKELRHRHILPFLGSVTLGGRIHMVSPWMKNKDIMQYLRQPQNLNVDCTFLLLQIALGLQYLHTRDPPVIHGDIKGENILISDSLEACICDFGLSQSQDGSIVTNSYTWQVAGNPRWQAPELLMAETTALGQRTKSSDIFAFGRVIVQLVTRQHPFPEVENSHAVVLKVVKGEAPPRPGSSEMDDRMWDLVNKCCSYNPDRRPDIDGVLRRLQRIIELRDARLTKLLSFFQSFRFY
ncbi:hypothetical protein BOTBODRAFT_105996, partial [Botryobasidium botryosum FD-172 SS1]